MILLVNFDEEKMFWASSTSEDSSISVPKKQMKLLLIGCGDGGKSTFHRQVRIASGENIILKEKKIFKNVIYSNIMEAVYQICVRSLQEDEPFKDNSLTVWLKKMN